ncbi:MAG: hypothetical protein AAFV07_13165 [Bacteroidota bacterium]
MGFLRFPFFIAILLLVVVMGYLIWYIRELGKARKEINMVFGQLEESYQQFVKKRLTLAMIEEQDLESGFEKIKGEAMQVLKPQIDSLISLVEAETFQNMRLQFKPRFFVSAKILVEKFSRTPSAGLSAEQQQQNRDQLRMAFQDGIMADLTQQSLALKTGEKLTP